MLKEHTKKTCNTCWHPTVPVTSTINGGQIQWAYIKEQPSGSQTLLTRCRCFDSVHDALLHNLKIIKISQHLGSFVPSSPRGFLLLNLTISRADRIRCTNTRDSWAKYEEKPLATPEGGKEEGRGGSRGAWIRQVHVKSVRDEPGCEWLD